MGDTTRGGTLALYTKHNFNILVFSKWLFCKDISVYTTDLFDTRLPCVHTYTHVLAEEISPETKTAKASWFYKIYRQEIDRRPLSCSLYQQTDWRTDFSGRQTDRQVPVSTGSTLTSPQVVQTPPDLLQKLFVHKFFLGHINPPGSNGRQCSNQSGLIRSLATVQQSVAKSWMYKVAMVTGGHGWHALSPSLCEPVESAQSLGNEVEESSTSVSPVLPVGGSVLRERRQKVILGQIKHLISDLFRRAKMLKHAHLFTRPTNSSQGIRDLFT